MMFTKKILIFISITLLSASCGTQQTIKLAGDANYNRELFVGSKKIFVAVADTNSKREQGLSGTKNLAEDTGMIFIFNSETRPAFWMKDMNYNLDLIWINKNKIIGITADVPAPTCNLSLETCNSNLPLYYPPSLVDQVLEVNAGWAKKNDIKIGDLIDLKD